ncbi:MAG: ADP-ribosylation factor-like protein [Promethearchaeota archaeon]
MADIKKIPILGIANAGKSSLIKVLQREFKSLSKLKPTKKIERIKLDFLDKELIIWDFGGQEKYRENYLNKASAYFSDVEDLFYVLDIKDQGALESGIKYFQDIIADLKEYSPDSTVNFLIHKSDPGTSETDPKLVSAVEEKFTEIMQPLKMRIYQTSIFNPIGVITAFSRALFDNTTLYDNFSQIFKDFVTKSSADFVIIFTERLLEIGNYFSDDVDPKKMRDIAQEIFRAFDDKKFKLDNLSLHVSGEILKITKFKAGDKYFYYTVGYNESLEENTPLLSLSTALLHEVNKFMSFF